MSANRNKSIAPTIHFITIENVFHSFILKERLNKEQARYPIPEMANTHRMPPMNCCFLSIIKLLTNYDNYLCKFRNLWQ